MVREEPPRQQPQQQEEEEEVVKGMGWRTLGPAGMALVLAGAAGHPGGADPGRCQAALDATAPPPASHAPHHPRVDGEAVTAPT